MLCVSDVTIITRVSPTQSRSRTLASPIAAAKTCLPVSISVIASARASSTTIIRAINAPLGDSAM
ncbi:hypothetical protein D3C81_1786570 [compost metagenome]